MSAASGVCDCHVLPLHCIFFCLNQSSFFPDLFFPNLGLFFLLSAAFFPQSLYFIEGVLPKSGLGSRAVTCLPQRQRSWGCVPHRPRITPHPGLRMTHSIPTAFLQKKKKVLPVPCPRFVPFLAPTEAHNFVCIFIGSHLISPRAVAQFAKSLL